MMPKPLAEHGTPMGPVEALDYAIFLINHFLVPEASSEEDLDLATDRAHEVLTVLVELRKSGERLREVLP